MIESTEKKVLADRAKLWNRLAQITLTQIDTLSSRTGCHSGSRRTDVDRVEQHLKQRTEAAHLAREQLLAANAPWWKRAWRLVSTELTTAPNRESPDPILVPEEIEYYKLIDNIPLEVVAEIEGHPEWFPGVRIRESVERGVSAHARGARHWQPHPTDRRRPARTPHYARCRQKMGPAGLSAGRPAGPQRHRTHVRSPSARRAWIAGASIRIRGARLFASKPCGNRSRGTTWCCRST